jgi:hypothetical protein
MIYIERLKRGFHHFGTHLEAGETIVFDSDVTPRVGDIVVLADGILRPVEDPDSEDAGNGAVIVGTLRPLNSARAPR